MQRSLVDAVAHAPGDFEKTPCLGIIACLYACAYVPQALLVGLLFRYPMAHDL